MATIAVFTANLVSINALVDKSKTEDITQFLIRSLKWVACMKIPGNTNYTCEPEAENILGFWRVWSADLLISVLGTEYFLLECSRKYTLYLTTLMSREWWTGWWELFVSWKEGIQEYFARRRERQSSQASGATSMRSGGSNMDDELKGVRLHPVALVDDFNPKASKAGV